MAKESQMIKNHGKCPQSLKSIFLKNVLAKTDPHRNLQKLPRSLAGAVFTNFCAKRFWQVRSLEKWTLSTYQQNYRQKQSTNIRY